jgi:hypothetical protein
MMRMGNRMTTWNGLLRGVTTSAFLGLCMLVLTPFLITSELAHADLFFNSSEPGCDGSDPNVVWCDAFERPQWGPTYGPANAANYGWYLTPYPPTGCPGNACVAGTPITPAGGTGTVCGGMGAAGTNCTGTSGLHPGAGIEGQAYFMGDHDIPATREFYFRYYIQDLPGFQIGQEKMLDVNPCCAGIGGIKYALLWHSIGDSNVRMPWLDTRTSQGNLIHNVSKVLMTPGTWWYLEVHIKLNDVGKTGSSANGIYELWIDNCGTDGLGCTGTPTLRARYTNVDYGGSQDGSSIGSLWLENWANPGSVGSTYYDQIKVAKVGPIGFAGVKQSTATPPAAPTNLRIQ